MHFAKRIPKFALMAALLSTLFICLIWLPSAPNSVSTNLIASSDQAVAKLNVPIQRKLKGMARKAASAEWFMSQRTYGLGYIPKDAEIRAVEDMRNRMIPELAAKGYSLRKSAAGQLNWEFHGPGNIGGRLRGLVVHPNNPDILYAGSVSGGVWKSTNGGASWSPTMNDLITLNISALAMKPGDPNTIYAGTGEAFFTGDRLPGHGILKTTDGGNTWKRMHVAQGLNSPFIAEIAVSPANPNVVYAAGRKALPQLGHRVETIPDRGVSAIFKSTDSGETWQDVTSGKGLEHDPQTELDDFAAEVIVSPEDANVVYATFGIFYASGGIWKSTDGGQTWARLTSGLPDPNLPNLGYRRIELAMAPSNPNVLYASFAYKSKIVDTIDLIDNGMLGLWKTTDAGLSWTQV
ncbi:MAG: WD40/YVTN/BNR-like repeat-containing protein, partial [bacterium]